MEKRKILLIVASIILAYFAIDLISYLSSSKESPPAISRANETARSTTSFASGGLGLSKADWEKTHTKSDLDYTALGIGYDGKYDVLFQQNNVCYIESQWRTENAVTPDVVKAESQGLIPSDSQLIETYSPEGRPETIVHLYLSESLKNRFNSKNSVSSSLWIGGEPGNFTVQYNQYEYGITRMIIGIGNNP